jgi:hypothetical protein
MPTVGVGSTSGAAGAVVSLPISFDPSTASVAGLQFNLTLPASLSTTSVTAGSILNTAVKSVSTNLNGTTWTFIIFGLNQNTIAAGTLLTAQVLISPNAPLGAIPVNISNVIYTDPNGNLITSGPSTGGTITVTGGAALPAPDLSGLPADAPVTAILGVGYPAIYTNVGFTWTFTPITAPTGSLSFSRSTLVTFNAIAAAGGAAFKTTSANTAPLLSYGLVPGAYTVTVQAFDSNGDVSPSSSKAITLVSADLNGVRVYPDPWRSDKHAGKPITYDQLTLGSTIKIFTVSGHLAKTLTPAGSSVQWDLTNDSGDKVASGLYLYLITDTSNNKAKGKLAIIR